VEKQRQVLHQNWQQKLERAGYEAERAARQYEAVEPENRLVARELERRWEEALHERARLEREYEQFGVDQPARLTGDQRGLIRRLAGDIPRLWSAATTTPADRQRLVRMLIERVVVIVRGSSERVEVAITWSGGSASRHEMVRPVQRYEQLADYRRLRARIDQLRGSGQSMAVVAAALNAEGFRPPKRVERFTGGMVAGFLARQCEHGGEPVAQALRKGEWLLGELARHLGIPLATLHHWRKAGWLHARKLPVPGGLWAVVATGDERRRLARLRRHQQAKPNQEIPEDLKTPRTNGPNRCNGKTPARTRT
jgi:hypothetical protein